MRKEEQVMIDRTNIEVFRKAYQACEGDTFIFEGQEVDKRFAMYFLQHWDQSTAEQQRRDEKHGLYPEKQDDAN